MRNARYLATAFIVGAVLGGCFGFMSGGSAMRGLAVGGAAGLAVAWLVIARESRA
jgi:hypothetical protein